MSKEDVTTVKVEFGRQPEWDNLDDPGEGGSAGTSRDVTIQDDSKDAQEGAGLDTLSRNEIMIEACFSLWTATSPALTCHQ